MALDTGAHQVKNDLGFPRATTTQKRFVAPPLHQYFSSRAKEPLQGAMTWGLSDTWMPAYRSLYSACLCACLSVQYLQYQCPSHQPPFILPPSAVVCAPSDSVLPVLVPVERNANFGSLPADH